MGRLDGKVALVTGGNTGIGRSVCLAFADEGADVAVNYIQREEEAQSLVKAIQTKGRRALAVKADVSDEGQVKAMVARVLATFGQLDILVNNAGIQQPKDFLEMTAANWDRMMAVNLRGTFLCCRHVAPHMVQRKNGRIINMASQLAHTSRPRSTGCSASTKGARSHMLFASRSTPQSNRQQEAERVPTGTMVAAMTATPPLPTT